MKHLRTIIIGILVLCSVSLSNAATLHVGVGYSHATLSSAAAVAQPGDVILVHNGTYYQRENISYLNGEPDNPILLIAEEKGKVIYTGQSEAWHLSSCSYLFIYGFVFQHQTANGVNIDDGGNDDQSANNITISHCTFRDMNASGNNDMLKLSGLYHFKVENCSFENGAAGGSGIDMVGCHFGVFKKNSFEKMGSNSIQVKGGSQFIEIGQNTFIDGGRRSLNLGGSTGLAYFRPIDATFEAADIVVWSNVFIGSWAPVAYVGSVRVKVINNTFYKPENWVFRILQETVDPNRFVECGDNEFSNNIIYFGNSLHRIVNIGPNTRPESFTFANNLWYNSDDSGFTSPDLPATESDAVIQQNPLFIDSENNDFDLKENSPAQGSGKQFEEIALDFKDRYFKEMPGIGAFEYQGAFKDFTGKIGTEWWYDFARLSGYQHMELTDKSIVDGIELSHLLYIEFGGDYVGDEDYLLHTKHSVTTYRHKNKNEFLPLVDFNLTKGDTMLSLIYNHSFETTAIHSVVDTIEFEYIAGTVRKVMKCSQIENDYINYGSSTVFIEDIYSVNSFMLGNAFGDYYKSDGLRCFIQKNEDGSNSITSFKDYPCDTVSVGIIEPITTIKLFPNPANGYITLLNENDLAGELSIFNLMGQLVFTQKINPGKRREDFDISSIPAGSYTLVLTGDNFLFSKKLIVLN